jgi:hypothetical protein
MRALVFGALALALPLACARQPNEPSPQNATAAQWDGGLSPPPPSTRKSVVVPSDVGMGGGPPSPTTNSGTPGAGASAPGSLGGN